MDGEIRESPFKGPAFAEKKRSFRSYRLTNIRFAIVSLATSSVLALGILAFGPIPVAVLCVLIGLVFYFCAHPVPLVLLWLAVLFYEEIVRMTVFTTASLTQLGNILLLPMDIPYTLSIAYLTITAVMRPREISRPFKDSPFLSLFLIMVLVSTILYTPLYGKMAIGEARKSFFYFLFPILTAISIKTPRNLHRLLVGVAFLAASISILGYIQLLIGPAIVRTTMRAVSAQGALILVFTIFSILITHANGAVVVNKTVDIAIVGVSLPLIFMAHHRTVFLAATLGLLLLFGLHRQKLLFVLKALASSIVLFTLIAVVFMKAPAFEGMFMKALHGIADPQSDETASWRMEGWRQQLTSLSACHPDL